MDFYINRRLLVINLDLFQLYLRQLSVPKGFIPPTSLVHTLIDLEHKIYFNIYSKTAKKDGR